MALLGVALFGGTALVGDSLILALGDCGMRSLRNVVGVRAEGVRGWLGRTKGVGGQRGAETGAGLLALLVLSDWHEQELLPALEG